MRYLSAVDDSISNTMGFFQKLKERLGKTQNKLVHEIKRIVTRSPKLTADSAEELEAALLSADFGMTMTLRIIEATRKAYESKGKGEFDFVKVAADEVEKALSSGDPSLLDQGDDLTVISMVGVNGTGKTTTCAKLANRLKQEGKTVNLAACDTFRAAAIDQLKGWRSSGCSPTPMNLTGIFSSFLMATTMPALLVPSSLVMPNPVNGTALLNSRA